MITDKLEIPDMTILIAHPDDEFLFGFPVLKKAKRIIACVDDRTHQTRYWCRERSVAFAELGKMLGIETLCLRYDSGFYRLPHADLRSFVKNVQSVIAGETCIFTHNGWGEYGHLDHILLHQIVRMSGKRMFTTDITLDADWYKVQAYDQGIVFGNFKNDIALHERCMEIYRSYGAMGWPYAPVDSCKLIEVI